MAAEPQTADRQAGRVEEGGSGRSQTAMLPSEREVADGASAGFSEVAATVTVDFLEMEGETYVRLSVLPAGGTVQLRTTVGPETFDFLGADGPFTVHVLHVDWHARTVRLRVAR